MLSLLMKFRYSVSCTYFSITLKRFFTYRPYASAYAYEALCT